MLVERCRPGLVMQCVPFGKGFTRKQLLRKGTIRRAYITEDLVNQNDVIWNSFKCRQHVIYIIPVLAC